MRRSSSFPTAALTALLFLTIIATPDGSGRARRGSRMAFGVNTFPTAAGIFSPADVGRAVRDLAPGSIVRFGVEWEWYQPGRRTDGSVCTERDTPLTCPTPGPINFAGLDAKLARLRSFGLRVMLAPLAAPAFARALEDLPSMVPPARRPFGFVVPPANDGTQLLRWQTFVRQLVRHVKAKFPGILAGVEIWNEPNGQLFWTTITGPDPARYASVLCHGYRGVRGADRRLPVLFAGTHPQVASKLPERLTVPDFVGGAYAAGAKRCMTSLAIHPYGELDPGNEVRGFLLAMRQIRRTAAKAGDAGRTLSITEIGAGGHQRAQADFLIRTYRMSKAMADVEMFIVHTLYDYVDRFGLCSSSRTPKLAASALKTELRGSRTRASC